ncbi:hypothetical protein Nepgr_000994 [Nepenthes gracilis]|uniref:Uncharacterized protein n=1 Tax=Nepenthes gracilis TaxID=150966 RepID=A0AAD3P5B6_NEPGR|nr:hypothetical protein Nepgr_000994 [Nepenthes gracilis]
MASASMAIPMTLATTKGLYKTTSDAFFKPSDAAVSASRNSSKIRRLQVHASLKEKAVTGLTAAVLTASMVVPQVAEAAGPGISPSLKNFLLSIVAGGVVLAVLGGAVIGVSYFDPVKRS